MSAHSAAPWVVSVEPGNGIIIRSRRRTGASVARVFAAEGDPEYEHNAKLIAAAPALADVLAAAQTMSDGGLDPFTDIDLAPRIRAALRAAGRLP